MDHLYQLAYISRSNLEGTDQVVEWELESILDAALRNNPAMGITGALMYSGNYFCQILEGPEASVRDLFNKITQDVRHSEVDTLLFDAVEERQFGQWAMAFAGIDACQRFDIEGIKQAPDGLFAKAMGKALVASLTQMVAERESNLGASGGPASRKNPA